MASRGARCLLQAVVYVGVILIGVATLEFVGQRFLFPNKLYFARNVDHRMEPGTRAGGRIVVNSDRIRSSREADEFRDEDLNIICLGDSFIFGTGLTEEESVPGILEARIQGLLPSVNVNVANFGWISSSPLLSYRLLRDIGKKYNPDIVILSIDMTDFHDDIKYARIIERKGVYRLLGPLPITVLAARRATWRIPLLNPLHEAIFKLPSERFFITEHPLSETLPDFSYIQNSIDATHAFCENELHARFMVVVMPKHYQYSERECPDNWEKDEYEILGPYCLEPFRYFEGIRSEVDYPIHSLLADFQESSVFPTCGDSDRHWVQAGADIAAEEILRRVIEEGCLDAVDQLSAWPSCQHHTRTNGGLCAGAGGCPFVRAVSAKVVGGHYESRRASKADMLRAARA